MRKGKYPQPGKKTPKTIPIVFNEEAQKLTPDKDLNLPLKCPENTTGESKTSPDVKTVPASAAISFVMVYMSARDALNDAVITQGITNPEFAAVSNMWCLVEKRANHNLYLEKLQVFIEAGNAFNKVLEQFCSIRDTILTQAKHSELISSISQIRNMYTQLPQIGTNVPVQAWLDLKLIEDFINEFYKAEGKLIIDRDRISDLLRIAAKLSSFTTELYVDICDALKNMFEIIKIQTSLNSSLENMLHNIENIIIECRLVIPILPEFTQHNISMNRDILAMQIQMLEHYTKLCGERVPLWAYLNRELLRPQSAKVNLHVNILLIQKRQEITLYTDQFAASLSSLSKTINVTGQIAYNVSKKKGDIDEHLQVMGELTLSEAYQTTPLVKFLVLSRTIECYNSKIFENQKPFLSSGKREMLEQDLGKLTDLLREFEQVMHSVASNRKDPLFKFINNFIFINNIFHEVVATTELAYLGYELVYRHTQDPKLKNTIITAQAQMLEIQCAILNCIKASFSDDHVRRYYFKGVGVCFYEYDVQMKNRVNAENGDLLNIIKGILIANILSYNEERQVKLETIPLELAAKQIEDQSDQYYGIAITEDELSNWEKQAIDEKRAEEEKKPALTKKQKDQKKRVKKANEQANAKRKEKEEEEGKPGEVRSKQLVSKKATDPMAEQLSELLLTLDPHKYCPEKIKAAINKLHPLMASSSNEEWLFNTRSAIGDSYSMIANHTAKQKFSDPEVIIVSMKLAFQYYRMATISLSKLAQVPEKKADFYHYYSWLHSTVGNQWRLLTNYVHNFSREYAKLCESQKAYNLRHPNAPDPRLDPNWVPSKKTLRRHLLKAALGEIDKSLPEKIGNSSAEYALHAKLPMSMTQIKFQDHDVENEAEPLPQLKFHTESAVSVDVASAQAAPETRIKKIGVVEERSTELKVPPKPQQAPQTTVIVPAENGRKPNAALSSLHSLEDKFKELQNILESKLQELERRMEAEVQRRVDERMTFVFQKYLAYMGKQNKSVPVEQQQEEEEEELYLDADVVSSDDEVGLDEYPPLPTAASSHSGASSSCSPAAGSSWLSVASSSPQYSSPSPLVMCPGVTPPPTVSFTRLVNFNTNNGVLGNVYPSPAPLPTDQHYPPIAASMPCVTVSLPSAEPDPLAEFRRNDGREVRPMRPLGSEASTAPQCSTALSSTHSSSGAAKTEIPTAVTLVSGSGKENTVPVHVQR